MLKDYKIEQNDTDEVTDEDEEVNEMQILMS